MNIEDRLLAKAQKLLTNASKIYDIGLYEDAGRNAYLAGHSAAKALLFVTTGKIFKTHKGVQIEFSLIVKDDNRFDHNMQVFLSQTYELKAIADYEEGEAAEVSPERVKLAILNAKKFLDCCSNAVKACSSKFA